LRCALNVYLNKCKRASACLRMCRSPRFRCYRAVVFRGKGLAILSEHGLG
jgi:hypothetical protein